MSPLVLASQSPRRRELLANMGFSFEIQIADIDESILLNEAPETAVKRLATEKALAIQATSGSGRVILASDTIVVAGEDILGKPQDQHHFEEMMTRLSGSTHRVMTAISVCDATRHVTQLVQTAVTFCELTQTDIASYWATGEPHDKAGGYGIQGIGGQFVLTINGSYSAVVGLPQVETKQLLASFGVYS